MLQQLHHLLRLSSLPFSTTPSSSTLEIKQDAIINIDEGLQHIFSQFQTHFRGLPNGHLLKLINVDGRNAISLAAELGNDELIRKFSKAPYLADINTPESKENMSPFLVAARFGHINAMKALVELGVKTDSANRRTGETALHSAASGDRVEVFSWLVDELGHSVKVRAQQELTPFLTAVIFDAIKNHSVVC